MSPTTTPSRLDPEILDEISAIAEDSGCEVYHAEYRGGTLRVFLDRPDGGVDLGDCERVSRELSAHLDVLDFGSGRYTLEVSSPGLDRPLHRPRDYRRFVGSLARVTFREDGRKKTLVGRLEAVTPAAGESGAENGTEDGAGDTPLESITLVPEEGRGAGEPLEIPFAAVEAARLEIEL